MPTFSGVDVPQQLVKLDCVQVTTGFGAVLRQVVAVADPEFPNQIMRIDSNGAVAITTIAPIEVTATTLPLPAGASTDTLQSTTNTLLDSIDDKLLTDAQLRASPLPLPTGAATAAKQPALGTAGTPSADVISVQGVSGGVPVPIEIVQPVGIAQGAIDVLEGNYPDRDFSKKFGYNGTVGTTDETIWSLASTAYPYLSAAQVITVSSSSASDTAAGTGAQTVFISGLDASYEPISETVTLNGLTAVNTVNQYLRVNRTWVLTAGATGANVGAVYIGYGTVTAGVPANTLAQIAIGSNQAAFSVYSVPAGYTAYLVNIEFGAGSAGGMGAPAYFELSTWVRNFGGVFRNRGRIPIVGSGEFNYSVALTVTEKSDFDLRARSNTGTGAIGVSYDMILVQN